VIIDVVIEGVVVVVVIVVVMVVVVETVTAVYMTMLPLRVFVVSQVARLVALRDQRVLDRFFLDSFLGLGVLVLCRLLCCVVLGSCLLDGWLLGMGLMSGYLLGR
jgi:hypothetical protein